MRSCRRIALSVAGCLWAGRHRAGRRDHGDDLRRADRSVSRHSCRPMSAAAANTVKNCLRPPRWGRPSNAIPRFGWHAANPPMCSSWSAARWGDLIQQGKVTAASRVDLANSPIGMVVKTGAPKPGHQHRGGAAPGPCSRQKSVGYSDSASGVYIGTELFRAPRHRPTR